MPERRPSPSLEVVFHPPRSPRWEELRRRGTMLERRGADPEWGGAVETFECDGEIWLIDADLGELRIDRRPGHLEVWPLPGIDRREFERRLCHDWLPALYTLWGWEAVHASAVAAEDRGATVAFVGASRVGKSTLAYALGRRAGWRQLTDDATAFRVVEGGVELLPIPSESRLRPPTAERFGRAPYVGEDLPSAEMGELVALYFLRPSERVDEITIGEMAPSRALQALLEQAFAFTLNKRQLRQRMVEDYFTLSTVVPSFRLVYRKDFGQLEALLEAIEAHAELLAASRATG